jgi:hypothetical protein
MQRVYMGGKNKVFIRTFLTVSDANPAKKGHRIFVAIHDKPSPRP